MGERPVTHGGQGADQAADRRAQQLHDNGTKARSRSPGVVTLSRSVHAVLALGTAPAATMASRSVKRIRSIVGPTR